MPWLRQSTDRETQRGQIRTTTQTYAPSEVTEERGEQVRVTSEETPDVESSSLKQQSESTTTQTKAAVTTTDTQNQHYAINVTMQVPFLSKEPVAPI